MRKRTAAVTVLILLCSLFFPAGSVRADYMLPYPSYMPGNKLYRISRAYDRLMGYWYFGDIARTKYHMMLADKYLVEAKTLFEYKQYLLAADALKRSDIQAALVPVSVRAGTTNGKDMSGLAASVGDEMAVHADLLETLGRSVPGEFVWSPEQSNSTVLRLGDLIHTSRILRLQVAGEAKGR